MSSLTAEGDAVVLNQPEAAESVTSSANVSTIVLAQDNARTTTAYAVILKYDNLYIKSRDCILRLAQSVFVLLYLILIVTGGTPDGDYLSLPFAWHLRVLVFTCTASLLVNMLRVSLHLTSTISMFPIDWSIFDAVVYGMLTLLFFIGTILVSNDLCTYESKYYHIPSSTTHQYIVAMVFGFCVCTPLHCAVVAISCYERWLRHNVDVLRPHGILLAQQSTSSVTTTVSNVQGV